MLELSGDLWKLHDDGAVVAITTGGAVSRSGRAALPRGCAQEANQRFPQLATILGGLIQQHGNHVFDLGERLVSFPVEHTPWEHPDPALIERSCRELVQLATTNGWLQVIVPRPGCGTGGLSWRDVRPLLHKYFDDRFTVINKEGDSHATG
jgi:hypothetical protein